MYRNSFRKIIISIILTLIILIALIELFLSLIKSTDVLLMIIFLILLLILIFGFMTFMVSKIVKSFWLDLKINDLLTNYLEDAILISDSNNIILSANKSFEKMGGYTEAELIGHNPSILKSGVHTKEFYEQMWDSIDQYGYWEGEVIDKTKDGMMFPKMMKIFVVKNKKNKIIRYVSVQSNIAEIKKLKSDVYNFEFYNELTKLPNMKKLTIDYQELIKENEKLVFYYIKVTNQVNIELKVKESGYIESLTYLTESIKNVLFPKEVLIYESDSSSFVVVIKNNDIDHTKVINEIIRQTNRIAIKDNIISLNLKVGVTEFPKYGTLLSNLITSAKIGANSILNEPNINYLISNKHIENETKEEIEIQTDLIYAINNNKLKVYYQPQINSKTKKVVGLEALIRWNHPEKGYIPPNVFIGIAEKQGLMNELDRYIFKQISKDYKVIEKLGEDISISVNISLISLLNDEFMKMIQSKVSKNQLPVDKMIIELTETQTTSDIDRLVERSKMIKDLGFKLSLDDFGTGYNALAVLFNVSFDEIKIDRSFIKDNMSNKDQSILTGIIKLGSSIGVSIVAEGVETSIQENFLDSINCIIIQGFLYSPALKLKEVIEYIKNKNNVH